MPKVAKDLTALEVRRLKQEGLHFVGGVPGLALRIKGPSKSWILRVAVGGKRREIGLGGLTSSNGLAEARRKAMEEREKIQQGIDPVQARRSARAALKAARFGGLTFKQAALEFIEANRAAWSSDKHARQWFATLDTYAFPSIGSMAVADINTAHVLQVLTEGDLWSQKPETASRLRQRIEKVLAAADVRAGRERLNPARWEVIGKSLPSKSKIAKVQHHAALPWAEMASFMTALRKQAGVGARALEFAVLTAARSGEVRGATWSEIDFKRNVWSISAERMKARRAHRVALSPQALNVLERARAMAGSKSLEPSELIFPGVGRRKLSDMAMAAVLRRMRIDATAHGFRATFRIWAGQATHYAREVIEDALAHQIGNASERAYARGDLLEKRVPLMCDWGSWCDGENADSRLVRAQ